MGLLRILLAFGVVVTHCGFLLPVGGAAAVEAFFVISGFYMALAFPKYATPGQFYLSRALRLFPAYWAALALCLVYYLVAAHFGAQIWFLQAVGRAGPKRSIFLVFANLFIVGSDWLWFTPGKQVSGLGMALPPLWSVSLELMFYLLCPVLLRLRTRWIALIALACVAARIIAYAAGFSSDPWEARFFPFELPFFLAGVVSYRVYATGDFPRSWLLISAPFILAASFFLWVYNLPLPPVYGIGEYFYTLLLIVLMALALPAIFERSRRSRLDAMIGEYSYPIYIFHYCFIEIFAMQAGANKNLALLVVLAMTAVHAALLDRYLQRPIDRWRHRRFPSVRASARPEGMPGSRIAAAPSDRPGAPQAASLTS